ncbi:MAG: hypothetical protein HFE28_03580 [Clostridia bacterium]|jgi:hypothetical protein|nr:hypothetical protein [Clostridia bacterium]
MRVYFLSEKPCVLFLNEIALGKVDLFERVCEIDPKDGIFCEMKAAGYTSASFVFNEAFLLDPPPQIKLYYTEDALAVYACDYVRADPCMKLLAQERFADCRLTLFLQGRVQLEFSRGANFTLIPLPDYLETGGIYRVGADFLIESDAGFALISNEGKLVTAARGKVTEKDYALSAEIPFGDSTGHTALCKWENGAMTSCAIRTRREPNEATFALALFESALIGADFTPFLCDALQEKASAFKQFLGDYTSVVLSDVPARVGLVYPRKERIFDVRYFTVTVEDGKITNITAE